MQGESLTDHRAPSARAKMDQVALFLAPRAKVAPLQDQLGAFQVLARIDP